MTRTTSHTGQYEPLVNDSIIQAATTAPPGKLTTMAIRTGCNKAWRSNGTNTQNHSNFPPCATRMFGNNGLFNDSPNSSGNRNTPTCFRCGVQGHMQHECRTRVFCSHCRSNSHGKKVCRKLTNNTPSPTNSHIRTGYHLTATPPPLIGNTSHQGTQATTQPRLQVQQRMNFGSITTKIKTNQEPAPPYIYQWQITCHQHQQPVLQRWSHNS